VWALRWWWIAQGVLKSVMRARSTKLPGDVEASRRLWIFTFSLRNKALGWSCRKRAGGCWGFIKGVDGSQYMDFGSDRDARGRESWPAWLNHLFKIKMQWLCNFIRAISNFSLCHFAREECFYWWRASESETPGDATPLRTRSRINEVIVRCGAAEFSYPFSVGKWHSVQWEIKWKVALKCFWEVRNQLRAFPVHHPLISTCSAPFTNIQDGLQPYRTAEDDCQLSCNWKLIVSHCHVNTRCPCTIPRHHKSNGALLLGDSPRQNSAPVF
jgi:hypothetical protein